MYNIGQKIRELRMSLGINQVEMAKTLSVSKQSISNWENNNILPSVDMLKRIADYFHCSTDYLLEMEEGKVYIETTHLTLEQTMHLQQLVEDFNLLNKKLSSFENTK